MNPKIEKLFTNVENQMMLLGEVINLPKRKLCLLLIHTFS